MTSAAIAAEIAAAYSEAGREAGDGIGAVSVTIERAGAPTGDPWSPTPGTPVEHTFTAKPADAMYRQRTGLSLAQGERVYSLVNHGVTITPTVADRLEIGGETWPVVEVIENNPAGGMLTWLVKVQK